MNIKIKDKVQTIPIVSWDKPICGVVLAIKEHNRKDPIEDHGCITVKLENGIKEHFVHHKWQSFLKVIK